MTEFLTIKDESLNALIQKIDESIALLKIKFGIELRSYEAMLRIAFNAIHTDTFNNILERLETNRELERGLENYGGYTLKSLENNNPKEDLKAIINFLKATKLKENALITHLQTSQKKEIAIFDTNELDLFKGRHCRPFYLRRSVCQCHRNPLPSCQIEQIKIHKGGTDG